MRKPMQFKVFKRINQSPVWGTLLYWICLEISQTSEMLSSLGTPLPLFHLVAVSWNRYFSFFLSVFFSPVPLPDFSIRLFVSKSGGEETANKRQSPEKYLLIKTSQDFDNLKRIHDAQLEALGAALFTFGGSFAFCRNTPLSYWQKPWHRK